MQGTISFHPIDLKLFEGVILPLVAGDKINPDPYLDAAARLRTVSVQARTWAQTLEQILEEAQPPPLPTEGTLWGKVRARLERFDHQPSALARLVAVNIDPDLHLRGRPFLITEGSAEHVASLVDDYLNAPGGSVVEALALEQLIRLDPELGRQIRPGEPPEPFSPMAYRSDLLGSLKELFELAQAARKGDGWGKGGAPRRPAAEALVSELAWRALSIHSRAVPFWIAMEVDGLETVCRAAEVSPPRFVMSARPLFAQAIDEFPQLGEALHAELQGPQDVAAYVAPPDVPELLSFLNTEGSRIIQAATRHGEGNACATLLRKIRECAAYAAKHGMGYVEASGIEP